MAEQRKRAQAQDEVEILDHAVRLRLDELRGDPIETEADERGAPDYTYDENREAAAIQFASRAFGTAIPIDLHHEQSVE